MGAGLIPDDASSKKFPSRCEKVLKPGNHSVKKKEEAKIAAQPQISESAVACHPSLFSHRLLAHATRAAER